MIEEEKTTIAMEFFIFFSRVASFLPLASLDPQEGLLLFQKP